MELFLIGLFGALVWFWMDSMATREVAEATGKQACKREGLQFLDDTVAFASLGFGRDDMTRLKLRRTYRFEFSDTGDNRLKGMIVLLGREVQTLDLEKRYIEVSRQSEARPEPPVDLFREWEKKRAKTAPQQAGSRAPSHPPEPVNTPSTTQPRISEWRWEGSHRPRHGRRSPTEEES
ncbi:MAG: DUF3301 domain-containing protein [Sulfuricellaceae bacterium]|nr:DUF3301 domain-containing protein [Sulfuricellaceae bacterium]